VERSAVLARLAQEIADRVRGPESWRNRIRGYALAHAANSLRVIGQLESAEAALNEAKRLWDAGSDPAALLEPGRLLQLEAPLRRDQRRFEEALARLDEAVIVSRSPELALINKGFTLEVMGEYSRAVETLLQAAPRVDQQAEPRLWNILRLNLANNFCHLGRHAEAAELVTEVRPRVAELGDEIDLMRILWLEGRIAAGLGRRAAALRLFAEARQRFAAEGMAYDVALLLLEEAVLLLEEDRTAEVKTLAQHLTQVFEDKGVHREALAALELFQKAAEREAATAELARRVLRYLYQARHDQGLRFNGS
jgi:tetratricopeptide (TPR) repeat protein